MNFFSSPFARLSAAASLLLLAIGGPLSGSAAGMEQPAPPADSALVAKVNEASLTEADFRTRCERFINGTPETAVGFSVLKEWIQQVLASREALSKGVSPTPAQVEARVHSLKKQMELKGVSFDEWLADRGRSLSSFREDIRQQLVAENLLTQGIAVNEAEVSLYFSNNKQDFGVPEQIRVSQITVEDRKIAVDIDAALKKGTAFEALAKKWSKDQYREAGGRVPDPIDVDSGDQATLDAPVLKRALAMDKGTTAGPIKATTGHVSEEGRLVPIPCWVFIRLDDRQPLRAPDLADVQELVTANLKVHKGGPDRLRQAQMRLDELLREAKIEIFRPEYQSLVKMLQKQK